MLGDSLLDKVVEVRGKITWYFKDHFDQTLNKPILDEITFHVIITCEVENFSMRFVSTEVDVVVVSIEGDKSLGPYGFNFSFFKKFRYFLNTDIYVMLDKFSKNVSVT